jgi:predicted dehydrogenase
MKMNDNRIRNGCRRREFLTFIALGGLGVATGHFGLLPSHAADQDEMSRKTPNAHPIDLVRIGFVGVGGRGNAHIDELLKIEGLEIRAICDIVESKVAVVQDKIVKAGKPKPTGYSRVPTDFQRMCETEDLDLVMTATPWEWHTPVCLAAMNHGKHAATEVPAAIRLDECWSLVEAAEKTGKYCIMLENCCYDRAEMMILNMVRKGLLGTLLHGECGYLHDRRASMFTGAGNALWRTAYSEKVNGDLYPTHGLGPIAQCMNINRGNQFIRLVSMGSQSLCLNEYAAAQFGPDSPQAKKHYTESDVVSTLIQTEAGQTITLTHDTQSPHPYSRNILLQGTKGIVRKYPEEKIHIDGRSKSDEWESMEKCRAEYEHPAWKQLAKKAKDGGHGGMDFIQAYRLIHALRTGIPPDMDVYDAASWSAVFALSQQSITAKNSPIEFPDFTRGKWRERTPIEIAPV